MYCRGYKECCIVPGALPSTSKRALSEHVVNDARATFCQLSLLPLARQQLAIPSGGDKIALNIDFVLNQ